MQHKTPDDALTEFGKRLKEAYAGGAEDAQWMAVVFVPAAEGRVSCFRTSWKFPPGLMPECTEALELCLGLRQAATGIDTSPLPAAEGIKLMEMTDTKEEEEKSDGDSGHTDDAMA